MSNVPGIKKGMPLAEVLQNSEKRVGTTKWSLKLTVILYQEEWPYITWCAGGKPAEMWPTQGVSKRLFWFAFKNVLQDIYTGQVDYWYVWDNWAWEKQHLGSGVGTWYPEVNSSPDPAPTCVPTEKYFSLSVPVALLSMFTATSPTTAPIQSGQFMWVPLLMGSQQLF